MTHNTREGIEEIVGKYRTMARSSVDSSDIGDWLRITLHQELQKVRADSYVEGYVDGIGVSGLGMPEDKKEELRQTIIDRYLLELKSIAQK
jgi:hypothetical protein